MCVYINKRIKTEAIHLLHWYYGIETTDIGRVLIHVPLSLLVVDAWHPNQFRAYYVNRSRLTLFYMTYSDENKRANLQSLHVVEWRRTTTGLYVYKYYSSTFDHRIVRRLTIKTSQIYATLLILSEYKYTLGITRRIQLNFVAFLFEETKTTFFRKICYSWLEFLVIFELKYRQEDWWNVCESILLAKNNKGYCCDCLHCIVAPVVVVVISVCV